MKQDRAVIARGQNMDLSIALFRAPCLHAGISAEATETSTFTRSSLIGTTVAISLNHEMNLFTKLYSSCVRTK